MIETWILWMIIGIIGVIFEIFHCKFYFFSIASGAILTGLFSFITNNIPIQIVFFILISLLSYILIKNISHKIFDFKSNHNTLSSLVGLSARVVRKMQPYKKGYVMVKGKEWLAFNNSMSELSLDSQVTITGFQGNILIVNSKEDK